ncbi:hypothetical protein Goari_023875, partial [Gossypium aridum]|nr:hypothetical protein [Gossypium aridum]
MTLLFLLLLSIKYGRNPREVTQKLILMLRLTKTKQAMGLSLEMRMVLSLAV